MKFPEQMQLLPFERGLKSVSVPATGRNLFSSQLVKEHWRQENLSVLHVTSVLAKRAHRALLCSVQAFGLQVSVVCTHKVAVGTSEVQGVLEACKIEQGSLSFNTCLQGGCDSM